MSLAELLPAVRELSVDEKRLLIAELSREVEDQKLAELFPTGVEVRIESPLEAYEAAAILQQTAGRDEGGEVSTPAVRFPYRVIPGGVGPTGQMPLAPVTLAHHSRAVSAEALVDTGSPVCLVPQAVGRQLGIDPKKHPLRVSIGGALAGSGGHALNLYIALAPFPPLYIPFVWMDDDRSPVILGQLGFLQEFDVCFFRSRAEFEIRPKP